MAILELETISDLTTSMADDPNVFVRRYHADGPFKGGGLFTRDTSNPQADGVVVFGGAGSRRWRRDLGSSVADAYMAGAYGDGAVDGSGKVLTEVAVGGTTVLTHDDSAAIQKLLTYLRDNAGNSTGSAKVSVRIGDGLFRVDTSLDLTSIRDAQGWSIDGSGATLLGRCKDKPVLDMTSSRFGTVLYLQVFGTSEPSRMPECGIKIGRRENNEASNQMRLDRVGTHGYHRLAGFLNIASEQFMEIGCHFENEQSSAANLASTPPYGDTYGYVADTFNSAEWGKPKAITDTSPGISKSAEATVHLANHGLSNNDRIMITSAEGMTQINNRVFVVANAAGDTFKLKEYIAGVLQYVESTGYGVYTGGGKVFKQRFFSDYVTPHSVPGASIPSTSRTTGAPGSAA